MHSQLEDGGNANTSKITAEACDPSVEGVFRIVIQRNLKEMIDLPEVRVWNVLPKTVQAKMIVRIRRFGFFFTHESQEKVMRCVLTRRNYLIVYAKERQLKGYAVKLSLAEKLNIYCSKLNKVRCTIVIKWRFGEISLTMPRDHIADWRTRILDAFDGSLVQTEKANSVDNEAKVTNAYAKKNSLLLLKQQRREGDKNAFHMRTLPNSPQQNLCSTPVVLLKKNRRSSSLGSITPVNADQKLFVKRPLIEPLNGENIMPKRQSFNGTELRGKYMGNYPVRKTEGRDRIINDDESDTSTIDYSATTRSTSEPRSSFLFETQSAKPSLPLIECNNLRRSWSSSILDHSRNNWNFGEYSNKPKLVVPRRIINRIERPLSVTPSEASWYTIVKRYGFNDGANLSPVSCIDESSQLVSVLKNENVLKSQELFKKRIIQDQLKVQQQTTVSWALPENAHFLERSLHAADINSNNNIFWRRRFFESDA